MIPPQDSTWVWRILYLVAFLIRIFYLRLRVEGKTHVPMSGGCVFAINHTMGPDYVIVGYASPRQVYYMAKAEIFAFHPWLAALVSGAGAFPVQRGKTGVARIAMEANSPIIPVVVINSEPVLRDVLKFKPRPVVTVRFGEPIAPEGSVDNPADVRRLTTTMMLGMAALLPPERHGYYADAEAVRELDRNEF